jgi:lathosterol oxidase
MRPLYGLFQIHDSDMITGHPLEKIINGPAHHTLHHMYFVVNYGQYFTWADKVGGSYRHPKNEDDPIHAIISREEARERLAAEKAALALAETKTETEAIAATTTTAVAKTSTMLRTQSNSDQSSRSRRSSQSGRSTPDLTEEEDATEEEEDVREAVTPFEELSASAAALRQRRTRTGTGKNAQLQP